MIPFVPFVNEELLSELDTKEITSLLYSKGDIYIVIRDGSAIEFELGPPHIETELHKVSAKDMQEREKDEYSFILEEKWTGRIRKEIVERKEYLRKNK